MSSKVLLIEGENIHITFNGQQRAEQPGVSSEFTMGETYFDDRNIGFLFTGEKLEVDITMPRNSTIQHDLEQFSHSDPAHNKRIDLTILSTTSPEGQ